MVLWLFKNEHLMKRMGESGRKSEKVMEIYLSESYVSPDGNTIEYHFLILKASDKGSMAVPRCSI